MKCIPHFILTVIVITLQAFQSHAQSDPLKFKPFTVELRKPFYHGVVSGNHTFVFFDERDDKNRMGFCLVDMKQFYFKFPDEAVIYLAQKFNTEKKNQASDTLFIGIRKLWIYETKMSSSLVKSILLTPVTTKGYCRVACNFYKHTGNDYALVYQYDSIYTKKGYLGNTNDELLGNGLLSMIRTADSICKFNSVRQDAVTKSYLDSKRKIPEIISAEKINDGIYLAYKDFLTNKPEAVVFDYKSNRAGQKIILSEKREDDSLFTKKCWGFCKNGIPYMRIGNSFSKLTKMENTFELVALGTVELKYKKVYDAFWTAVNMGTDLAGPIPALALLDMPTTKPTNTMLISGVFKLDIETGDIY